jgi:hypothetical protein
MAPTPNAAWMTPSSAWQTGSSSAQSSRQWRHGAVAAESGDCDDVDACDRHWRVVHWAGGSGGRRRQRPKWKEIRLNHVPPPTFEKWGESDKEELIWLKTTEMDITETALGRYAALMKRQAFASVLDFTDEE